MCQDWLKQAGKLKVSNDYGKIIMSMQDPISDMLTQIRNGLSASKCQVTFPASNNKIKIANLLKEEGFISDCTTDVIDGKAVMTIDLKYVDEKPVIDLIKRVSKPSRRVYCRSSNLPKIQGGFGIAVISTSQGVMTDRAARKLGIGGEVVCTVY